MDHYQVLGVDKKASVAEIKKAYRRLALKNHPDKGGNPEEFKKVNEAYAVLSDPEKRTAYDRGDQGISSHFEAGDAFDIFAQFFNGRDPFRDFFDDDDDLFFRGGGLRSGGFSHFGRAFGHQDPFGQDDFFSGFGSSSISSSSFSTGGNNSFSGTSISTTTVIQNGKRISKTTKTIRHPDGRVETTTEESSGNQQPRQKLQYTNGNIENGRRNSTGMNSRSSYHRSIGF